MFFTLLIILLIVIAVFLLLASFRPSQFRYMRVGNIHALPAAVFPHVDDLHRWNAWSPWARMDPDCKTTFEGAENGTGAIMKWNGNKKVDEGMITIIATRPDEFIKLQLQFFKPFKAINTAEFTFTGIGEETQVVWVMYGKNNFAGKLMGMLIDCDKMVGNQFEQGLANLKQVVESGKAA